MNNIIKYAGGLIFALGLGSAHARDVNVGVNIAGEIQPGVYGRINIGNAPPPVVYAQPMVITRRPRAVVVEPVYMHVPPGHAKKWSAHCHHYHACDRPVYFVRSREYEPGYGRGHGRGHEDRGYRHRHGHHDRDYH